MANPQFSAGEKNEMNGLMDETHELTRWHLEHSSQVLSNLISVHENGVAFYEKVILFDVGTIALSLTFLGQLVAHLPGGHVPRHAFTWLLCPAWFLLLISIQCSVQRIVGLHNLNLLLVHQLSTSIAEEAGQRMRIITTRFNDAIGNFQFSKYQVKDISYSAPMDPQSETQPASIIFANMNDALAKAIKEDSN
jgi:hypothetical protein